MSLTYDSTRCENPVPTDDNDSTLREILIFGTVIIGMSEITEGNYREFYARSHAMELLGGAWRVKSLKRGTKGVMLTLVEVKRWIGLRTNASRLSKSQFNKKMEYFIRDFIKESE